MGDRGVLEILNINLRPLRKDDLPLTLAWRNNKEVYDGFYQQSQDRAIVWDDHVRWNKGRNSDWRTFIVMYEDRPVGLITIGQLDNWEPEIGVCIGELTLWGKGVGKEAVFCGTEWLREYAVEHEHIVATRATILDSNSRSIKLFISLGFERIASARRNESLYRKWL